MLKIRFLGRLTGSRRVLRSCWETAYYRCVCNKSIPRDNVFFSSNSTARGFASENPKSICYQSGVEEAKGEVVDSDKEIKKGDIVNLSQLLFTKYRDYLVRYNDPQQVTADQLAGKVVVVLSVSGYRHCWNRNLVNANLIDVYNDLKLKNCFEVVCFLDTSLDDADLFPDASLEIESQSQIFEDMFSRMPWTAIPVSDRKSREYLTRRLGLSTDHDGIIVDLTGMVLQTSCADIIDIYGSPGYPFSDEMIAVLDSEDNVVAKQPSLKNLLVSPQRDYVISNKGEKIPIHTLENKVVALYFYEDSNYPPYPIVGLTRAYEKLAENNINFEVVLIYLTDTCQTCENTNEESFWETFRTMPWLALPFKDPIHKKLTRLFSYPKLHDGPEEVPTLVIFGPNGEFIEPAGADVWSFFDVPAYPYTRENLTKLETKQVMEMKLEMLCSPTTIFRGKDGSEVQFSRLAGKRVIFFFESERAKDSSTGFLKMLEERYRQLKGTCDEFEVIHILHSKDESFYNEQIGGLPWLVSSAIEFLPGSSDCLSFYGIFYRKYEWSFLLAFDRDGRLVRRTVSPMFQHADFPFYAGSLEDEAFYKLHIHFIDRYWDTQYDGLLRYSSYKNRIARGSPFAHLFAHLLVR